MAIGVRILSDNLSGQTTNVTYLPDTGGTIDLGSKVFPFNYISSYYYGMYDCYVPTYGYTYSLNVPGPTPTNTVTPTPTPTNTVTPTNTITPTNTVTPTNTATPTNTPTVTKTPTGTPSVTPTNTPTPNETPTPTPTNIPTVPPVNTTPPLITGTNMPNPFVGTTITTSNGTWDNSPTSFTYQWSRGLFAIVDAVLSTYVLEPGDIGQEVKCTVTATNEVGSTSEPTSNSAYSLG